MDETHPVSAVAQGGIFAWKDGRENPDTCTVAFTYPKGFLYMYRTTFGNSYRSFSRIQGRDGTIVNYGGEGASLFVVTREGGREEFDPGKSGPVYTGRRRWVHKKMAQTLSVSKTLRRRIPSVRKIMMPIIS